MNRSGSLPNNSQTFSSTTKPVLHNNNNNQQQQQQQVSYTQNHRKRTLMSIGSWPLDLSEVGTAGPAPSLVDP
jgi:hypothetical protein